MPFIPKNTPKSKKATGTPTGATGAMIGNSILHSTPIQSGSLVISRRAIVNEKRFYNENSTAVNKFVDSIDFESSATSSVAELFEFNQGFKGLEPLILYSSNFSPLYKDGLKSEAYNSLQLKQDSKILNMKTALDVLLQNKGFKDEIVANQKKSLLDFVKSQNKTLYEISNSTIETVASLDVSSYKEKITKEDGTQKEVGFVQFLRENGYVNVEDFSNTKIWQQSLLELKKSLLAHSNVLLGEKPTTINDSNSWVLYGVNSRDQAIKKRIWFNPYISLPSIKDFFSLPNTNRDQNITDKDIIKLKLISYKELMVDLERHQYLDLSVNADPAIKVSSDPNDNNTTQLANGNLKNASSNKILNKYADLTGRDISILANMIFKEFIYSSALANPEKNNLTKSESLSNYGYSILPSGDNFRIWDHIIGRFPGDVRDVINSPTGEGNSLATFSQKSQGSYQILTFEKNNVLKNRKTLTPGSSYYIESSLNTVGLARNDFSRLDDLKKSTKNSIDTLEKIYSFLSYYKDEKTENYVRSINEDYSLISLVNELSIVSKTYKSCLALETTRTINGKDYQAARDLDSSKLKKLSEEESVGIRLASTICKFAISSNKSGAEDIKSLLFMWLMNKLISQIEKNAAAEINAAVLQEYIAKALKDISIDLQFDFFKAADEGRTYPFDIGNNSVEIEQNAKIATVIGTGRQENKNIFELSESTNDLINNFYRNSISSRIFDTKKFGNGVNSLWSIMLNILKKLYNESFIKIDNVTNTEVTQYSGMSKVSYFYSMFDLMLRIVAAQTPEDFLGTYSNKVYEFNLPDASEISSFKIKESGFLLSPVSRATIQEYFNSDLLNNNVTNYYSTKLRNAIKNLQLEDEYNFSSIKMFLNYLKTLQFKLSKFYDTVDKNLKNYSNNVSTFFSEDSLSELGDYERSALFNLSLSQEQTMLNRYIMSEYVDRLENNSNSESKLKKNPEFSKFEKGFSDLVSVNDVEIISYDLLSSYFNSPEFQQIKSNNKKIISFGFPPKLIRSLMSNGNPNADVIGKILQNIIRVRLYKIDRLRPTIVYKPQEYLFELNRFSTRILSNWNVDAIINESVNIFEIPTKLFDSSNNSFRVCRDFSQAFPAELYGLSNEKLIDESTKQSIYANHVKSFLAEEYLRWMTDLRLDETRYYHYTSLTEDVSLITNQYKTYLNYLEVQLPSQQTINSSVGNRSLIATFTDPVSKNEYVVPINTTTISGAEQFLESRQSLGRGASKTEKRFNLSLDSTMTSYFQNETILSDDNQHLRRRAVLPKKFDRTFSVIFDPDDFVVDSYSEDTALDKALGEGIITNDNGVYRHRDTSPQDVTFDEYFITVEPYDYVLPTQL